MKKKTKKILCCALVLIALFSVFAINAFAAGDVAGAIENTWNDAQDQIKTVVNNATVPVIETGTGNCHIIIHFHHFSCHCSVGILYKLYSIFRIIRFFKCILNYITDYTV